MGDVGENPQTVYVVQAERDKVVKPEVHDEAAERLRQHPILALFRS